MQKIPFFNHWACKQGWNILHPKWTSRPWQPAIDRTASGAHTHWAFCKEASKVLCMQQDSCSKQHLSLRSHVTVPIMNDHLNNGPFGWCLCWTPHPMNSRVCIRFTTLSNESKRNSTVNRKKSYVHLSVGTCAGFPSVVQWIMLTLLPAMLTRESAANFLKKQLPSKPLPLK